jgi:fused signal recognition particle receptor
MFDGLKDKLGSFREDVEEQAEEAEAETGEAEAETGEAEAETGEAELEAPETEKTETEESQQAAAEATSGGAAEAEPAETEAAEPAEESEEVSAGAGLGARAKALATGKVIIDEDDLEGPLWDLEMALLESDVEMSVAETILEEVKADLVGERKGAISSTSALVADALRDALVAVISVGQFDFEQRIAQADKPVVIVFTGVNGVGKTTSIVKLSEWLEDRGFSSVLANGDTYRAGANEQIREHAEVLDRKLITHEQGGDPAAVIYDGAEYAKANDVDVVLGDTAGRLHTSNDLMAQLEKIDRVVDPDMTLFVDEAVAGQDAVKRAKQFDEAAAIDGSILTKADADSQGGAAISIAHATGKPILFLGTGQEYDDIQRFDPEQLVEQLLED